MKFKFSYTAVALLLTFGAAAAHADSVSLTLNNGSQNISSQNGGTLTYSATSTADAGNGAAVFLNGDSFNVSAPVTLNDADFFSNYPFFQNATDTYTGALFTLNIPAGTALGTYTGYFTLLGGADGGAADSLATVNYSVTVTPEPSSLVLLGTGALSAFAAIRRKRFSVR